MDIAYAFRSNSYILIDLYPIDMIDSWCQDWLTIKKGITMDQDTLNYLIDLMDQLQIEKIPGIDSRSTHLSSTIDDLYQLKLERDQDVFNIR